MTRSLFRSVAVACSFQVAVAVAAASTSPQEQDQQQQQRDLITNGQNATAGTYPFFGFTQFGRGRGCGATLIHSDILLTASHCALVFDDRGAYIGGTTNFGKSGDGQAVEFHEDDQVLQHPDYDSKTFANDIMLVKLETSSSITPARLNRDAANNPAVGDPLTVIGFGDTKEDGNLSPTLLQATVSASEFGPCQALFLNQSEVLLEPTQQFCAFDTTGAGMDACQADSGGPLFNAAGEQVGITSFGIGCARSPGVYVQVSHYIDWIDANICLLSSNPPASCPTPAPTSSPTSAPTTRSPTLAPTTRSPTLAPTTRSPTLAPISVSTSGGSEPEDGPPPTPSPSSGDGGTSISSQPPIPNGFFTLAGLFLGFFAL